MTFARGSNIYVFFRSFFWLDFVNDSGYFRDNFNLAGICSPEAYDFWIEVLINLPKMALLFLLFITYPLRNSAMLPIEQLRQ